MVNVKAYLIINIILTSAVISLAKDENKQKEIVALEKEKSDLLKQIHIAIDDSVNLLQKDNNTQNLKGIKYMLELKQQMQKQNETESQNMTLMEESSNSELENRRTMKHSKGSKIERQLQYHFQTTLGKSFDLKQVLFGKKMPADKLKQMLESRQEMQKRLDEWILQRELEKAKIRERYLASKRLVLAGMLEKCPRFGNRKRKRGFRRSNHGNCSSSIESDIFGDERHRRKPKKPKKMKTYPCCRKCCKMSYLGCL